jgi:NitT/TauT family transport system ATP-binding protein
VLLASRVLVFSSRPARIVADIAIPLPHPRHRELTRDAAFRDLTEAVQAALWQGTAPDRPLAAE